ncbi:glycerol-3-phosphate 1-O-acyltransferase PlsY [Desulfitibacter alkalitolerans]|uniref:glycerol-3-phosphate 1-O-acyltransferase PlsY n=1 Tax=Desulfitibacter alkalitolerans TaxID=264641 RepID=UPI000B093E82|nr:glycerol-3-phosphate 1-O-acyltransferase PlsY [Desulfitibacter alkalitolerans]
MTIIFLIVVGYLLGSIPSGLIVGKLISGVDIREHGSGNLGGTNAFRVLGVKGGLIVTSADIVKGIIPAYIGLIWMGELGAIIAGISAIFGHAYPLFASLRGGKSVATGTGVFLVLMPYAIAIAAIVFFITLLTTQYVSLASLLGALTLVIASIALKESAWKIIISILVVIFVTYRHRGNVKRLLYGTESKAKLWKRRF